MEIWIDRLAGYGGMPPVRHRNERPPSAQKLLNSGIRRLDVLTVVSECYRDVTPTTRAVLKPRQVQKEKCGVHPLRTWFIGLFAKARLRCFCHFAQ